MKYKVGDKVKIREDLRWGGSFGLWVNDEMIQYAGKTVEIISTDNDCYNFRGVSYCWNDKMIEGLVSQTFNFAPILKEGLSEVQKSINDFKELLDKGIPIVQVAEDNTFTWEEFKNREVCINCKGNESIVAFLKECDKQDISFEQGDYVDKSLVSWYEDRIAYQYDGEICFLVREDYVKGLAHDLKEFFAEEGFKVVEYQQQPKTLEDYSDAELVKELLRRHTK